MRKLLCAACVLLAACSGGQKGPDGTQTIVYEYSASETGTPIGEAISSITILPLETTDASLVSSEDKLIVHRGEYLVVDQGFRATRRNISRFDARGRFLNTIGTAGRADNEYTDITDVIPTDAGVDIYCRQSNAIFSWSPDGKFVSKKPFALGSDHIAPARGGGYWAYKGYGNGEMPERVVRTDDAGETIGKFLPSDATVIHMTEEYNNFVADGENVLVWETLGGRVWSIDPQGTVGEKYVFDLGRYGPPAGYFDSTSDPMQKAMNLMASDFASFYSFFDNRSRSVLQITYQFGATGERGDEAMVTGFRSGKQWRWVKSGTSQAPSILTHSARALTDDNVLVLLVDNYKIREFVGQNPGLVRNATVLDGMDDDAANPSILLCKLK